MSERTGIVLALICNALVLVFCFVSIPEAIRVGFGLVILGAVLFAGLKVLWGIFTVITSPEAQAWVERAERERDKP